MSCPALGTGDEDVSDGDFVLLVRTLERISLQEERKRKPQIGGKGKDWVLGLRAVGR